MPGFPIHGDLALSSDGRRFVLRQGIDEYADRVRAALQIVQGAWHYDTDIGLRFFDVIFEKPTSVGLPLLLSEVRRVIATVPGTESVLSVTYEYSSATRSIVVNWIAKSRYGVVEGTEEIA